MEKDKTGHDPAISPGNFKEYGRHLRMLFPKPSDTDIDATVTTIILKLKFSIMPPDIESAYRMAARILRDRRRDYAGIGSLPTVRSRALAMLAVDYMDGLCTRETLCGWKGQLTFRNLKRRNGKED